MKEVPLKLIAEKAVAFKITTGRQPKPASNTDTKQKGPDRPWPKGGPEVTRDDVNRYRRPGTDRSTNNDSKPT